MYLFFFLLPQSWIFVCVVGSAIHRRVGRVGIDVSRPRKPTQTISPAPASYGNDCHAQAYSRPPPRNDSFVMETRQKVYFRDR
ncbi:hypothetical protein LY76DRAFT_591500 [Colletotrichum caudatum]|nr:hypothetical protein LY76DRAFT_591500 [Colletotrichum caudatum]